MTSAIAATVLPTMMIATTARTFSGSLDQYVRLEQHSDGNKEQNREGVAQRQRLFSRPMAEFRLAHHHPGEEGSERERNAEQFGRAIGHAHCDGYDAQREQLAGARSGHQPKQSREHAASGHQHQRDKGSDLGKRDSERRPDVSLAAGDGGTGRAAEKGRDRRQ